MRYGKFLSLGVLTALLAGCTTIEHRSEALPKKPLPVVASNAIKPKVVWTNSQSAGLGKSHGKLRLAVTDAQIIVADHKGKILSLNPKTGKKHWEVSTNQAIAAGPSVIQDKIVVGTKDGQVLAYQLASGAQSWEAKVNGAILAAPQGNPEVVFVHVMDGSVFAFRTRDGKELWRYASHTPPLMLRRSSSPVLHKNHVLVGFSTGKLKALDKRDGVPIWEREIGVSQGRSDPQRMIDISADPVVKHNRIYAVSYQGKIAALQADSGQLIWERPLSSHSGIAVGEKDLFVSDHEGVLWALTENSGKTIWKQDALYGRQLSAPALWHQYVVVGDEEGYLHWLSRADGAYLGRTKVDGAGVEAVPHIKEGILYVLGRGGKVIAYAAPSEDLKGS